MPEYDNTNRGVLFKNDKKSKETHPDYTGKIDVGGEEYTLAAWIKDGKRGKFMSLRVETETYKGNGSTPKPAKQDEDDIPFAPNHL